MAKLFKGFMLSNGKIPLSSVKTTKYLDSDEFFESLGV
jgi:hypothetical protein